MRYPRSGIGGNPAGHPTTWLSKIALKYPKFDVILPFRFLQTNSLLRLLGRLSVVPIVFEGFYDWGVIIGAADESLDIEP